MENRSTSLEPTPAASISNIGHRQHQPIKIIAGCSIEPNCHSRVFRLHVQRLLTILDPDRHQTSLINNYQTPSKSIIVNSNQDGQLVVSSNNGAGVGQSQCSTNQNDYYWLYNVRLASNCFEQNLIAYPVKSNQHDDVDDVIVVDRDDDNDHDLCYQRSSPSIGSNGHRNHRSHPRNHHHRHHLSSGSSSSSLLSWSVPVVYVAMRPIEPGEELCFWPWFGLSLSLGLAPFLLPVNIVNENCYVCHWCGNCYAQPNPLKVHLVFGCVKRPIPSLPLTLDQTSTTTPITVPSSLSTSSIQAAYHQPSSITSTTTSTIEQQQDHNNRNVQRTSNRISTNGTSSNISSANIINNNNNHNTITTNNNSLATRRLHTCTYCGKLYTRKYGLKIHIRTHTGLKPLNCRYCGRSFSDPSNLNKHMRLHRQHQQQNAQQQQQLQTTSQTTQQMKQISTTNTANRSHCQLIDINHNNIKSHHFLH